MNELKPEQVQILDEFWSPRLDVNAHQAIFHQWQQLEKSGCIDNFRLVTNEITGFREGWFFADSDAHKWLDAASRSYAIIPDAKLEKLILDYLDLLMRAQQPDGYLFTYNQLHFPGQRWIALQVEHELYCHGHLIEGCLACYAATGAKQALQVAIKAADLLVRDFMHAGAAGAPGHQEIEIALLRLYQATGQPAYLELARRFLERRGHIALFPLKLLQQFRQSEKRGALVRQMRKEYSAQHPEYSITKVPPGNVSKKPRFMTARWYWNALSGRYAQQHKPIRQQTAPAGHAVRFGYLETAIALLHRLSPDATLLPALEQAWEHMLTRHMYVTGGLGALPGLEGFGADYELDPEFAYAETCAALASLFWNWEMTLITHKARYSDLFEWQLYNAAAVGMGLDGTRYLYNNPLACRGGVSRSSWYAVPCCPSNISRTWASLGKYIFSYTQDALYLHQYFGCQAEINLHTGLKLRVESGLPFNGQVRMVFDPQQATTFSLYLRLPAWGVGKDGRYALTAAVNGEPLVLPTPPAPGELCAQGVDPRRASFLQLERTWQAGDEVKMVWELPVTLRIAHPKVAGHAGKVAVTRGPLVYCLESVDNPATDLFSVRLDPTSLRAEIVPHLLGGMTVVRGQSVDGQPLTFIPYALWGNRGLSMMNVWVNCG